MIRVADYIAGRLYEEKIRHIFMITGRGILYLSDAVAKHDDLMAVAVHHEQTAAYAANGYAQYNNHLGACFVSTGCGSTNAITGVLNAWQDHIPVVYVSGQNVLKETTYYTGAETRTFGNQEANIIPIVDSITKYSVMVTDPQKIGYIMDKALYEAKSGIRGPVWIDVPVDVQNMRVDPKELERYQGYKDLIEPKEDELLEIHKDIHKAKRPIMLIGSHIRTLNLEKQCIEFAKRMNMPIVTEQNASDLFPYENHLVLGSVAALGGNRSANFAIQNSDYILAVGAGLNPVTTGDEYHRFAREAYITAVHEYDLSLKMETVEINKVLTVNISSFFNKALELPAKTIGEEWVKKCAYWRDLFPRTVCHSQESDPIDLYDLAEVLSVHGQRESVFITDAGLEELIIPTALKLKEGQRCIHPAAQGSMGTALGLAIGSYFSSQKSIVVIIGDGSLMMNLQELATIKQYNIPIKIFVNNNNMYDIIRQRQKQLFRNRTIGTDSVNGVGSVEFKRIGDCFDLLYTSITVTSELSSGVKCVLETQGPVLCEIIGKEEQKYLHNSFRMNERKRLIKTYLEDQSPFLELELIKREMLIEMDV